MNGLVGGPLLVGGLGPGPPAPLNPALLRVAICCCARDSNSMYFIGGVHTRATLRVAALVKNAPCVFASAAQHMCERRH